VDQAEQRGLDRERLLAATGIDPGALEVRDGRVSLEAFEAFWREVERITADPDVGLALAEAASTGAEYGVVGFLAMTSPTLEDALTRTVAFHSVIKEGIRASLRDEGADLVFEQASAPGPRAIIEHGLGSITVLARRWTEGAVAPKLVRLRHARPRDTSPHERVFACPVVFDQPENALVFDRDARGLPFHTAQPALASYLEWLARSAFDKLSPGDLAGAVRDAIRMGLSRGDFGLAAAARRLGVSTRTLQRRLTEERLTFKDLVDEVRRTDGLSLVLSTDLQLLEISERLGYSESKAFRRAFHRWTGASPAGLRRQQLASDQPARRRR
jgi:AraC-like DNA-binding protein